jgi:hypothetical protein
MQKKLNRRHVVCLFIIGCLSFVPSILSAETFHEYLIRTSQIPSGRCIWFNSKPSAKNRAISISIEQTEGKRPYRISLSNFTTDFCSNEYQIVIAIGPNKLPDFLSGEKVKGCAIRISAGSDENKAWRVRSSESFIESETQAIDFDGKTDGSEPIMIKIGGGSFVVNIQEVANRGD